MKEISITISGSKYDNLEELPSVDKTLMEAAIKATATSYSPYSNFKVGAALLMEDDSIVTGSNQENAAYPSGMCAERIAIWKAATSFPGKKIKKIAITANSPDTTVDTPIGPCGACRQVLLEYEINQQQPIEVIFMGEVGEVIKIESIKALLPFSFDGAYLRAC
jgi:cytidine deaminase